MIVIMIMIIIIIIIIINNNYNNNIPLTEYEYLPHHHNNHNNNHNVPKHFEHHPVTLQLTHHQYIYIYIIEGEKKSSICEPSAVCRLPMVIWCAFSRQIGPIRHCYAPAHPRLRRRHEQLCNKVCRHALLIKCCLRLRGKHSLPYSVHYD